MSVERAPGPEGTYHHHLSQVFAQDLTRVKKITGLAINVFEGANVMHTLVFEPNLPAADDLNLRLAAAHVINPKPINASVYYNKTP